MNISLTLQLISTAIMIIGIAFGIQNIRQYRASRKREAAIMMLNSFQTSEFVRGLLQIFDLPEGVRKSELDELPADQYLAIYMVIGTWERLGILVYRREIDLELVDDAYSGPVIQSWLKLEGYIQDFRAYVQRRQLSSGSNGLPSECWKERVRRRLFQRTSLIATGSKNGNIIVLSIP